MDKQEFIAQKEMENQLQTIFQNLLEKNKDSADGFSKMADEATGPRVAEYLFKRAEVHRNYQAELMEELLKIDKIKTASGTAAAAAHRLWIDLKNKVTDYSDADILQDCITGMQAAKEEYERYLSEKLLPKAQADILTRHYNEITKCLEELRILLDVEVK